MQKILSLSFLCILAFGCCFMARASESSSGTAIRALLATMPIITHPE